MMNYAGQCFELEQWFQPFGREATFLEHLRSLAEPWVDECWIDEIGVADTGKPCAGFRTVIG